MFSLRAFRLEQVLICTRASVGAPLSSSLGVSAPCSSLGARALSCGNGDVDRTVVERSAGLSVPLARVSAAGDVCGA